MIKVVEVTNRKLMKKFVEFPLKLYKDCPYYVPSIYGDEMLITNPKKNLSLGTSEVKCFLALDDHKIVVGRICAIINHDANKKNNEKAIRFSRIDMIDDIKVTEALLDAVISFGKEKGLEFIQGPWGFNDSDREGMLTYGYDEYSSYATAYSYPYYAEHMEKLGYQKESEWIEKRIHTDKYDERYPKVAAMLEKRGYHEIADDYKKPSQVVKKYGDKFFECYNKAYADLDNFTKIEGKAMKAVLQTFAVLLNKDYFAVVVNEKDDVVAFGVGLPYIGGCLKKADGKMLKAALPILKTIKNPKKIELALIGVLPEYRNSGVHSIVVNKFIKNTRDNRIQDMFFDPTLTTNAKMLNSFLGMDLSLRCMRQTYRKEFK